MKGEIKMFKIAPKVYSSMFSLPTEIADKGLNGWLKSKGVLSLEGKSCRDIVDCIRSFIEVDVAGLDNTAANEALEHIMDMLELEKKREKISKKQKSIKASLK